METVDFRLEKLEICNDKFEAEIESIKKSINKSVTNETILEKDIKRLDMRMEKIEQNTQDLKDMLINYRYVEPVEEMKYYKRLMFGNILLMLLNLLALYIQKKPL